MTNPQTTRSDPAGTTPPRPLDPAYRRLPGPIFALIGAGLASVVVMGWLAFGASNDTVMTMFIASVFAAVALGTPILLARTSRGRIPGADGRARPVGTARWLHGPFETLTGRVSGRTAAIQILLPVLAVALGFVLIALELALVQP